MKKSVKNLFLALTILTLSSSNNIAVKADAEGASSLISKTESERSFYYYNEAYNEIIKLDNETKKNELLGKLASLYSVVWNQDIININKELDTLVKTASGKVYEDVQVIIANANIYYLDKEYLLGEVTSWGKQLVWTEDYSLAMEALLNAWTNTNADSVKKAENAINSINNSYSRQYLLDELNNLRAVKNISPSGLQIVSSAEAYRQVIEKALGNFEDKITFEVQGYNSAVYNLEIINKIIDENPIIDYGYASVNLRTSWTGSGSTRKFELTFSYKKTKEEMLMMKTKAEQKAAEIIKSIITPEMKDYEKVLAIHDYIVINGSYDKDNYDRGTIPPESYTDYGILINGKAVCEGYAKAMFRLLNSVGVKSLYVTGTANNEGHAWNIVHLGGEYYHIDATWDDPVTSTGESVLRHNYFNVTDAVMEKDHAWDRSKYPECKETAYSYSNIRK